MTESWLSAPWVETYEDYSYVDAPLNINDLAWFDVKITLVETDNEKKEQIEATQQQIKMGILQKNGLPAGMAVPQGAIDAFNKRSEERKIFKLPNNPVTLPKAGLNVFQQAKKKMSMMDKLTSDRRKL